MRYQYFITILLAAQIVTATVPARDVEPQTYPPAVALLSTGTTVVGEPIVYPSGTPHVTSAVLTIAPGSQTIVHKHGVPMFAYILQGELVVNYGADGTRTYRQGDAFVEAMNVAHFGINNGTEPVRILVVYMGADGAAADVIPVK